MTHFQKNNFKNGLTIRPYYLQQNKLYKTDERQSLSKKDSSWAFAAALFILNVDSDCWFISNLQQQWWCLPLLVNKTQFSRN